MYVKCLLFVENDAFKAWFVSVILIVKSSQLICGDFYNQRKSIEMINGIVAEMIVIRREKNG